MTTLFVGLTGMLYSVFMFITGTRAELQSHSGRIKNNEERLDKIEVSLGARLDRMEGKMDAHHATVNDALIRLATRDRGDDK